MNTVALSGRLTADPTVRSAGAHDVTRFRIAVDNGQHATTYVDCEAWGRLGVAVATHVRKARLVGVTGSLRQSEWTDTAGQHHERHYVTATSVDFLDRPTEIHSAPTAA